MSEDTVCPRSGILTTQQGPVIPTPSEHPSACRDDGPGARSLDTRVPIVPFAIVLPGGGGGTPVVLKKNRWKSDPSHGASWYLKW